MTPFVALLDVSKKSPFFVFLLASLVLLYVVYDKADDVNEEGPLHDSV